MSARQRARMAAAMALTSQPSSSDEDEDEEQTSTSRPSVKASVFAARTSSSNSEQEENSDENDADSLENFPTKLALDRFAAAFDESSESSGSESPSDQAMAKKTTETIKSTGSKKNAKGKRKQKKISSVGSGSAKPPASAVEDLDLAQLEDHLNTLREKEANTSMGHLTEFSFLEVDSSALDADSLLKQRLNMERRRGGRAGARAAGREAAGAAAAAVPGGRRASGPSSVSSRMKRINKMGGTKRFIFGMPRDEWPDAPSFGAGGIGMVPDDSAVGTFRFVWSDDYKELSQQYERIQMSGDPNRLVEFLSEYPYLIDALLQLASVFIRTGDVNKAYDLVRRALFYLNWGEHEAFNPCGGSCRLNPSIPENASYFSAVFFNMKLVGMFGCPSVSAGLAKLLLSLDPVGDSMNLWLLLDYYLIAAAEASDFEEIYQRLSTVSLGEITVLDFPNWKASGALCAFLRSKASGLFSEFADEEAIVDYKALSDERLQCTFLDYPYILWSFANRILNSSEHRGFSGTAASHVSRAQWQALQSHTFYQNGHSLVTPTLSHFLELYESRCGELWTNVQSGAGQAHLLDIDKWIYDNAIAVVSNPHFSSEKALESCRAKWSRMSSCLEKYRRANPEDFTDNITRFPLDANPLDPRFTDPNKPLPINREDVERARALRLAQQNQPRRQRVAQMRQVGFEGGDVHWQFDADTMGGAEYLEPLVDRIARLPAPLRDFIVGIVERRLEQLRGTEDFDALLDTESVLAEALYMRDSEGDDGRAVDPNELARIVAEAMRVDPFDFQRDVHIRAEQQRREAGTLDLNQPLLQLFIRSFLPWNHL